MSGIFGSMVVWNRTNRGKKKTTLDPLLCFLSIYSCWYCHHAFRSLVNLHVNVSSEEWYNFERWNDGNIARSIISTAHFPVGNIGGGTPAVTGSTTRLPVLPCWLLSRTEPLGREEFAPRAKPGRSSAKYRMVQPGPTCGFADSCETKIYCPKLVALPIKL